MQLKRRGKILNIPSVNNHFQKNGFQHLELIHDSGGASSNNTAEEAKLESTCIYKSRNRKAALWLLTSVSFERPLMLHLLQWKCSVEKQYKTVAGPKQAVGRLVSTSWAAAGLVTF